VTRAAQILGTITGGRFVISARHTTVGWKVLTGTEIGANVLAVCLGGLLTSTNLWWLVSNYGEHSYSCIGKPLPCLSYSKVEDPYALLGLALFLCVLALVLLATGFHVWTHSRVFLIALLGITGVYWIMLILSLAIFVAGYLLSGLALFIGCAAAVAAQLQRRVDVLTAS